MYIRNFSLLVLRYLRGLILVFGERYLHARKGIHLLAG